MSIRPLILAYITLLGSAYAATNQAIVVSAPRLDDLDLMAVDVAADVTVIDRSTIEQSGATSVPELLSSQSQRTCSRHHRYGAEWADFHAWVGETRICAPWCSLMGIK